MKLTAILLLASTLAVNAKTFSQKVTISQKNIRLKEVFQVIKTQTGLDFFYDKSLIRDNPKTSLDLRNVPVKDVLDQCLKGTGIDYVIKNNAIILKKSTPVPATENLAFDEPGVPPIEGRVTDDNGKPLAGASITVKGTKQTVTTDGNGKFTLNIIKNDDILVVSYVGYENKEVKASEGLIITLTPSNKKMDEVVVIGYGTQKKAGVTGSIVQIKGDNLAKSPTTSPMAALQGAVAGVQIVNSGAPGAAPTVRIRGVGSFNAPPSGNRTNAANTTGQPLFVVDGMLFDDINFLNNNDIQDMSVLKDASAAAIYGVRAANGVIVITTKKGSVNKPATVSFDTYVGIQKSVNELKMASSNEYALMMKELNAAGIASGAGFLKKSIQLYGGDTASLVPATNTNWFDQVLRSSAVMQNYNLDISGGTAKAAYAFGGTYLNQNGIMNVDNKYSRATLRAKADFQAADFLKMGVNLIFSNSTQGIPNNGAMQSAFINPSIYPAYDLKRSPLATPIPFASPTQVNLSDYFTNPMADLVYGSNTKEKITRLVPSIYADISILPRNKLVLRTVYSSDLSFGDLRRYTPKYNVGPGELTSTSTLRRENNNYKNYVWDNTLTFVNNYKKSNYSILLGTSWREQTYSYMMVQADNVPGDKVEYLYVINGNENGRVARDDGYRYRGLSYFTRLTYNYDSKYLLTATMRADGSSKYQNKWGYFPSVGLGWVVSKENFMANQKVFDFLKIRGSWGELGNDKIQANDGFVATLSGLDNSGTFRDNILPGTITNSYYSTLGWEAVAETDFGLELRALKNRLSFDFDYFYRLTNHAVIANPIPNSLTTLLKNSGTILNRGFEFGIGWNDRLGSDFRYFANVNFTTLKNEVKDLQGLPYILTGSAEFRQIDMVGKPVDAFFGYQQAGIYQNQKEISDDPAAVANGLQPGDIRFVDQNQDKKINADDRVIIGSYIPTLTYGFNVGFNYKAFDFSASFSGISGSQIINIKRGIRRWQTFINYDEKQVNERWHGDGTSNLYPSTAGTVKLWNVTNFSSFYVEDASYFRIQNIQIGYTLGQNVFKQLKRGNLHIYATAERPLTFFKANVVTPEIANGRDELVYPVTSLYTIGLKLTY